jgi:hypothetical protein
MNVGDDCFVGDECLLDLAERLETLQAEGHQALIFTQFVDERHGARAIARAAPAISPAVSTARALVGADPRADRLPLQEQEQDSVARYVNQAAEQTERLSEYLSERDANELVREVEDFARNRPAVFLGGAFAIGIAAARFLKSSAGQREALEIDAGAATSGSDRSAVRLGEETSQG